MGYKTRAASQIQNKKNTKHSGDNRAVKLFHQPTGSCHAQQSQQPHSYSCGQAPSSRRGGRVEKSKKEKEMQ